MLDKIIFQTNVPQELALRFLEGKPSQSQFANGMQHMFSTTDNRVFYVSETVGVLITKQLKDLEVQPGDCITITKAEVDTGRGKRAIRWQVAPVSDDRPAAKRPVESAKPAPAAAEAYGDRSDGTYAVPALKPVPVPISAPRPEMPEWAQVLLASTNVIVDVYASAVKHAAKHEGLVKPDVVQSVLITALINLSKNSTLAVGK